MEKIGIICEFNPFHNGHLYFINKIREKYKDSSLILVMSSYFTQRGDVSLISKGDKVDISLKYGIDLILELPTLYTLNSADIFAYYSVKILNILGVDKIIFGSESNNINLLNDIVNRQFDDNFNNDVKKYLSEGYNYPTSLSKALNITISPNDTLGISYIKAIYKINKNINVELIKRTNDYNDINSTKPIVSASNIRYKILNNEKISKYIPNYGVKKINTPNYSKLFELLKYKIISENDISKYLGVDEGLENKIVKAISVSSSYKDLINNIKSKRYTEARIRRMLLHILLGIEKEDIKYDIEYARVLGFNCKGKKLIKNANIRFNNDKKVDIIEKRCEFIYNIIVKNSSNYKECNNKPTII